MNWSDLWAALALLLVIEGVMPFVSPSRFKQNMQQILSISDANLRIIGLASMIGGLVLLYLVR